MRIAAVVCEYNPFHNGHKYQLERIREESGCDKILCLMSGCFTQRGDMALFDKYTRARHAVENGADLVLELPAAFAAGSAEQFARGAVHILASIPAVKVLCFGSESGTKEDFLAAAGATLSEDRQFKALLKENMKDGTSYVKARTQAVLALHKEMDERLFTQPNNILGIEYCRALLQEGKGIEPLPLARVGGGFREEGLLKNFSSATAIRSAVARGEKKEKKLLKANVPQNVFAELARTEAGRTPYPEAAMCALLSASPEEVCRCPDCSEGLENRLRTMAKSNSGYEAVLEKCISKRYTRSRLKRIFLQNFLKIDRKDVRLYLENPLYYKVLAVKKNGAEGLLGALSQGSFRPLTRKSDVQGLKREALACFELDAHALELYNVLSHGNRNEFEMMQV